MLKADFDGKVVSVKFKHVHPNMSTDKAFVEEQTQRAAEMWRDLATQTSNLSPLDSKEYVKVLKKRNGITFCWLYVDNVLVNWNVALCSKKDKFNKRIGRLVSFGQLRLYDSIPEELRVFLSTIKVG